MTKLATPADKICVSLGVLSSIRSFPLAASRRVSARPLPTRSCEIICRVGARPFLLTGAGASQSWRSLIGSVARDQCPGIALGRGAPSLRIDHQLLPLGASV